MLDIYGRHIVPGGAAECECDDGNPILCVSADAYLPYHYRLEETGCGDFSCTDEIHGSGCAAPAAPGIGTLPLECPCAFGDDEYPDCPTNEDPVFDFCDIDPRGAFLTPHAGQYALLHEISGVWQIRAEVRIVRATFRNCINPCSCGAGCESDPFGCCEMCDNPDGCEPDPGGTTICYSAAEQAAAFDTGPGMSGFVEDPSCGGTPGGCCGGVTYQDDWVCIGRVRLTWHLDPTFDPDLDLLSEGDFSRVRRSKLGPATIAHTMAEQVWSGNANPCFCAQSTRLTAPIGPTFAVAGVDDFVDVGVFVTADVELPYTFHYDRVQPSSDTGCSTECTEDCETHETATDVA